MCGSSSTMRSASEEKGVGGLSRRRPPVITLYLNGLALNWRLSSGETSKACRPLWYGERLSRELTIRMAQVNAVPGVVPDEGVSAPEEMKLRLARRWPGDVCVGAVT